MPVIKSAKKKLRQDKKAAIRNAKMETELKDAIKAAKKHATLATVKKATSEADKAAKRHIIHRNKAAHIKSSLSKLLGEKTPKLGTKASEKVKSNIKKAPSSKKSSPKKK